MTRPAVEVADAMRAFGPGFEVEYGHTLSPAQLAELARWQRELETALNQLYVAWVNNLKAGVEAWAAPVRRRQE